MRRDHAASITSKYDKNSAIVGTNKVYAVIHQFGGNAGIGGKVKIPARPYLNMDSENLILIMDKINQYLID